MKMLNVTPEIGFTIKNLRMQYNKTAKEISELVTINKTKSYFSKLEKGDVKKIELELFISILNEITNSDKGLDIFLDLMSNEYDNLDIINKVNFINLDDIIRLITIDSKFLAYVNKFITDKEISVNEICNKINKNEDIRHLSEDVYDNLPYNIWTALSENFNDCVIKLHYSFDTIDDILKGKIEKTNYITILAILYTLFLFNGENVDKARFNARKLINDFGMNNTRSKYINSRTIDLNEDFAGLEPSTVEAYQSVITQLKILLVINKKYAAKRFDIIESNLKNDLGFTFAFMSSDLTDLLDLPKDTKQNFLNDLRDLIKKYTQSGQQTLDLYLDE